jgi:hypothetical protein
MKRRIIPSALALVSSLLSAGAPTAAEITVLSSISYLGTPEAAVVISAKGLEPGVRLGISWTRDDTAIGIETLGHQREQHR